MEHKIKKLFTGVYFRRGGYSVGLIFLVLAIIAVINLLVGRLPSDLRRLDISSNRIYTVGEVTKGVLAALDKEVSILVIAEPDQVDGRITKLVENYRALSPHIKTETIDPVLHPGVLDQYQTTENSIVVWCGETNRQQSVPFEDIIQFDQMSYYYYQQYVETEFDGEGQLTSAIDYVTSENSKKLYFTAGHGEEELFEQITDLIDKANMTLEAVNLLQEGKAPDDSDLLIINAPDTDLAEDEKQMLKDYLGEGGAVLILLGTKEVKMPNLESILKTYGMTVADGYIADTENFYQDSYYNFFAAPDTSHDICSGLDSQKLTLVTNARGMTLTEPERSSIQTAAFLSTSDQAYAVTEDGQTQGTYVLGASAEETLGSTEGRLTVISAGALIDSLITSRFTNLSNLDIFMNAVRWNFDDVSNISIPAKSLEPAYNSIPSGGAWGLVFIALIPLVFLGTGFIVWLRRRKA